MFARRVDMHLKSSVVEFTQRLEKDILPLLRKPIARKLQKLRHFLVNICSVRRGGQFLPSQQLGNIGHRNFGGSR